MGSMNPTAFPGAFSPAASILPVELPPGKQLCISPAGQEPLSFVPTQRILLTRVGLQRRWTAARLRAVPELSKSCRAKIQHFDF